MFGQYSQNFKTTPNLKPGLIRASASAALYNTGADIHALPKALTRAGAGKYLGDYRQNPVTGELVSQWWQLPFSEEQPIGESL